MTRKPYHSSKPPKTGCNGTVLKPSVVLNYGFLDINKVINNHNSIIYSNTCVIFSSHVALQHKTWSKPGPKSTKVVIHTN